MIDDGFETKVLACIYRVREFCAVASEFVKPDYFASPVKKNMAKMAIDFYKQYKTMITPNAFADKMKVLRDKKFVREEEIPIYVREYSAIQQTDISDHKYILDRLIEFIKVSEWRLLIDKSAIDLLPNAKIEEIEKIARKIQSISVKVDVEPYDYFAKDSIEDRYQRREKERDLQIVGISTGIAMLDKFLPGHGWARKELYYVTGSAKAGKTMAMLWFANVAALIGYKVAYFTCETSKDRLSDRLDAMNTDIETNSLPEHTLVCRDKMLSMSVKGRTLIYEYPTKRLTPSEVTRQFEKAEVERGIRYDMAVFDYPDIMRPTVSTGDVYQDQTAIAEELRGVVHDWNCAGIGGNQVGKGSANKAEIVGSDGSGAWGKTQTVDGNLTLGCTKDDLAKGRMTIKLSDFRNAPVKTFKIGTAYHMGRFYKETLEEVL